MNKLHPTLKSYPSLLQQLEALSESDMDDEHVKPIIVAKFVLEILQPYIEIGICSEEDVMQLTIDQAKFVYGAISTASVLKSTRPVQEWRTLFAQSIPPRGGCYGDCFDSFILKYPGLLTIEQILQLSPEQSSTLHREALAFHNYPEDYDWQNFVISRCLGLPVPPIKEQDRTKSLRYQLQTQIVESDYLTNSDLNLLSYRAAKVLIEFYPTLLSEKIPFSSIRTLLQSEENLYCYRFALIRACVLNREHNVQLKMADILQISNENAHTILDCLVFGQTWADDLINEYLRTQGNMRLGM